MDSINFSQIAVLLAQGLLISALMLLLFWLRKVMGIGMLFAALGLFQFMQVFLSSSLYVNITDSIIVSPGSSLLFTATIFSILIIYIKEDAIVTRKVVYAVVTANLVMILLIYSFSFNSFDTDIAILKNNFSNFFHTNAWIYFIGTVMLFIDSVLLIFLYEYISGKFKNVFLRICITMILILSLDALLFSLGAFFHSDKLKEILISGLISKFVISIYYSVIFSIYLKVFEKDVYISKQPTFQEIFHSLTYKQKFQKSKETAEINEKRFQTLTDMSPVGIFVTDGNGKTEYVNPSWCKISGLTKENAMDDGWFDAVHPKDRIKLQKGWKNAVGKKEASYAEYRFVKPDGSISWVLGQAIPQYTSDKLTGYIGTTTDITKIKLFEIELQKTKEKAEENERLKTAFLNNISHEIRTPMNGILGFAKLLNKPSLTEDETSSFVQMIEESSERLLNIINNIINISEIESKRTDINISEININEITEMISEKHKKNCEEKRIHLILNNGLNNNDSNIKTDKIKFTAILSNLVRNAIKFTNKGTVEFGYNKNDDYLNFYVKDTGIGISDTRLKTIFDPFSQAEIDSINAYDGAGLGLSISKSYIELLGGTIHVSSIVGEGSNFTFTLPYYRSNFD